MMLEAASYHLLALHVGVGAWETAAESETDKAWNSCSIFLGHPVSVTAIQLCLLFLKGKRHFIELLLHK